MPGTAFRPLSPDRRPRPLPSPCIISLAALPTYPRVATTGHAPPPLAAPLSPLARRIRTSAHVTCTSARAILKPMHQHSPVISPHRESHTHTHTHVASIRTHAHAHSLPCHRPAPRVRSTVVRCHGVCARRVSADGTPRARSCVSAVPGMSLRPRICVPHSRGGRIRTLSLPPNETIRFS